MRLLERVARPAASDGARPRCGLLPRGRRCCAPPARAGLDSAAAYARSRMASASWGSTWTTTSAPGTTRSTASSMASAPAWPCSTAAAEGTPMTTSAKWRPAARRIRSRRSWTRGSSSSIAAERASRARAGTRSMRTSTFALISRLAAARTRTLTKRAAMASPSGWPARATSSPTRTAASPRSRSRKWRTFIANAGLCVPARRTRRHGRAAHVDHDDDPDDRKANQSAVTSCRPGPAGRSRSRRWRGRSGRASRPPRALRGAPPCRARTGGPRSGGRPATPTAKNVRRAATRSVPECAASDRRPRLPAWIPAASLRPMRASAAKTETRAVRRWGDMGRVCTADVAIL